MFCKQVNGANKQTSSIFWPCFHTTKVWMLKNIWVICMNLVHFEVFAIFGPYFCIKMIYRGPAPFHRLTPNKRFEPVFSTVIMAVCSLFNRMLLLTDLIPVHLVYCGQTMMKGCNHTSFEWTRAVRHIYGIIRHMQGLY